MAAFQEPIRWMKELINTFNQYNKSSHTICDNFDTAKIIGSINVNAETNMRDASSHDKRQKHDPNINTQKMVPSSVFLWNPNTNVRTPLEFFVYQN